MFHANVELPKDTPGARPWYPRHVPTFGKQLELALGLEDQPRPALPGPEARYFHRARAYAAERKKLFEAVGFDDPTVSPDAWAVFRNERNRHNRERRRQGLYATNEDTAIREFLDGWHSIFPSGY